MLAQEQVLLHVQPELGIRGFGGFLGQAVLLAISAVPLSWATAAGGAHQLSWRAALLLLFHPVASAKILVCCSNSGRRYRGLDAATLFWFGRPRIILRCIQVVYFENSLACKPWLRVFYVDCSPCILAQIPSSMARPS